MPDAVVLAVAGVALAVAVAIRWHGSGLIAR
jgi:hypothetical protein